MLFTVKCKAEFLLFLMQQMFFSVTLLFKPQYKSIKSTIAPFTAGMNMHLVVFDELCKHYKKDTLDTCTNSKIKCCTGAS